MQKEEAKLSNCWGDSWLVFNWSLTGGLSGGSSEHPIHLQPYHTTSIDTWRLCVEGLIYGRGQFIRISIVRSYMYKHTHTPEWVNEDDEWIHLVLNSRCNETYCLTPTCQFVALLLVSHSLYLSPLKYLWWDYLSNRHRKCNWILHLNGNECHIKTRYQQ